MDDDRTKELFTASAWGGLPLAQRRAQVQVAREPVQEEVPTLVELLGFPKGTPASQLVRILEDIQATPVGQRVDKLFAPGTLSRLFSQSGAQASYAMAILSIVESPHYATTLARLRSA